MLKSGYAAVANIAMATREDWQPMMPRLAHTGSRRGHGRGHGRGGTLLLVAASLGTRPPASCSSVPSSVCGRVCAADPVPRAASCSGAAGLQALPSRPCGKQPLAAAAATRAQSSRCTLVSAARGVAAAAGASQSSAGATTPAVCRIVLTGGPCGGKSTALRAIADDLRRAGLPTIVVPECATFMVENGVDRVGMIGTPAGLLDFNYQYALLQLEHEARLGAIAVAAATHSSSHRTGSGPPASHRYQAVLLCDRGMMDSKCYMSPETWRKLCDKLGLEEPALCERRYERVLHLVTAADGAEEAFTLVSGNESTNATGTHQSPTHSPAVLDRASPNASETTVGVAFSALRWQAGNAARTETPAQARELDRAMLAVWARHPAVTVVGNTDGNGGGRGFDAKVARAVLAARSAAGVD